MDILTKDDLDHYAEVLCWGLTVSRAVPFRNGELVVIRYDAQALPLAEALYARLLAAHLHPVALARPTASMERELFVEGSFGQLTFPQPGLDRLYSLAAGVVTLHAPDRLDHLADVDPAAVAEARHAAQAATAGMEARKRSGLVGWTECVYPTAALAAAAGLPLEEYASLLRRACLLNMSDPVKEWKQTERKLAEICAWLDGLNSRLLHIESPGIDLRLAPGDKRKWVRACGRNIPGFELYLAPDWRSAQGRYYADQPSIILGRPVQGVRMEFHDGVGLLRQADRGERFLAERLSSDGGVRRIGEFSLTDVRHSRVTRFMAHTLLDENLGASQGNCHIALGQAAVESFRGPAEALSPDMEDRFGFNRSALHWDLVNTEPKRVRSIGPGGQAMTIYEDGRFNC